MQNCIAISVQWKNWTRYKMHVIETMKKGMQINSWKTFTPLDFFQTMYSKGSLPSFLSLLTILSREAEWQKLMSF